MKNTFELATDTTNLIAEEKSDSKSEFLSAHFALHNLMAQRMDACSWSLYNQALQAELSSRQ